MPTTDWNAPATLHMRDDGGSEMHYNFAVLAKGTLGDLVSQVAAMPADERARVLIDVAGGSTLNVGEILALAAQTITDFTVKQPNGTPLNLADKAGKVLLVVNTASKCGFTPQYDGLEALWRKYGERGFEVLAFPCNQFGGQEPGTAEEIDTFCKVNFGVSFPLMAKIEVNGAKADPLYQWLKTGAPGVLGTKGIKWNFTKFLIGRDGKVVRRYGPTDKPEKLEADIEALL
jgi:glutathione peroxidase